MASVYKTANGTWSIAVVIGERRPVIRLGRMTAKQVESLRVLVDDLATARRTRTSPRNTTVEWVNTLDPTLRRRFEKAGLIDPIERVTVPTLGAWLDSYIGGRRDVKERTLINFLQVKKQLLAFFPTDRPLDRITPGEADGFAIWLRTERKLSEGTARRQVKRVKQFFAAAQRMRLIADNPFGHIKCGNFAENRFYFVSRQEAQAVLDECPDVEWRLIFALARFGGLRIPSEMLGLEWGDVNWEKNRFTVRSPKTAHHDGKGSRVVPIFPELLPYLREAFEVAKPGTRYVIARHRDGNANLRTQLTRIIGRAGLTTWPKLFVNLRSTRETELAERFPLHVVTAWLGNSPDVARKYYLQTTEEHFARAAGEEAQQKVEQKVEHFPQQQAAAKNCAELQEAPNVEHNSRERKELCASMQSGGTSCNSAQIELGTPTGTRTPVHRLRTYYPRPLDDGGISASRTPGI